MKTHFTRLKMLQSRGHIPCAMPEEHFGPHSNQSLIQYWMQDVCVVRPCAVVLGAVYRTPVFQVSGCQLKAYFMSEKCMNRTCEHHFRAQYVILKSFLVRTILSYSSSLSSRYVTERDVWVYLSRFPQEAVADVLNKIWHDVGCKFNSASHATRDLQDA